MVASDWLVRSIGFQQDPLDRHALDDASQALGAGIADGAADTEVKAQAQQLVGLLATAGEGVDDAAQAGLAAQLGNHLVHGLAGMDDDGKFQLRSQLQLLTEIPLLGFAITVWRMEIQPYFTDSYGLARAFQQPGLQCSDVFRAMVGQEQGVQPVGGMNAGLAGKLFHAWPVTATGGRHDLLADAVPARVPDQAVAIGIKAGVIQMDMAVGKFIHGRSVADAGQRGKRRVAGKGTGVLSGHDSWSDSVQWQGSPMDQSPLLPAMPARRRDGFNASIRNIRE